MKRQVVKGLTMFVMMVTVGLATAVISANAQSQRRLVTNVPFEFVIGDKALPAGEYVSTSGSAVLVIQGSENKETALRLTNSITSRSNKSEPRLVFHRYGQTYFLAEVWSGGDEQGRQLLPSKQERQMKREISRIAKSNYETIELVATLR